MKVTIGGDFYIAPEYQNSNLLSDELVSFFENSDINILNLETPVITGENTSKILKTGPHLFTTEKIFEYLKRINISCVTLANNHILDYGENGLIQTLDACKKYKILTCGAGLNLKEASVPTILEKNGIKLALVNFCENEWSIADFVFVIIHGGHEYYNLPSPRMVRQYRFFAENGADAIIGHHTHCISGFELHNNVPIFYSLGNMLFTRPNKNEEWFRGLILQFDINKGKTIQWNLHPIIQSYNDYSLNLMIDNLKEETLDDFNSFSKIIKDDEELIERWNEFVEQQQKLLRVFSPLNIIPSKYLRLALYKFIFRNHFISKKNIKQLLNLTRCEAHRDLTIELLKKEITKDNA